jgi:hypothetical protein
MFYAYSTGTPMPFDKQALVGELRELKFLERYTFKKDSDEMRDLLVLYNRMVRRINDLGGEWTYDPDSYEEPIARPFATNIPAIFSRPQPMAGFGAECKRLLSTNVVSSIDDIHEAVDRMDFTAEVENSIIQLLMILDQTGLRAKRIGDAQRAYFQCAFRALLLPESETFADLSRAWLRGQEIFELTY